eukprot:TRINITY_DN76045_c0_g1_i1.p1 TRINITY_DN76045_c0_g1~~TRINITY_DN76045_c0_g1_i1.p1  ORF type:complete len:881 (-),score=108.57 TRINITY_DN76045_c0_g1_i1:53-2653(-)
MASQSQSRSSRLVNCAAFAFLVMRFVVDAGPAFVSGAPGSNDRSPRSFALEDDSFILDGQKILLRSGSVHYHRIPREYWRDRLLRAKAMGLNAIQTLVPWNWHEEREGVFNFKGDRDLAEFLSIAHDLQLLVLLRPGPYICAEWEFGGFPAWLLVHNVTLRTYEPNFIAQMDKWWDVLLPKVKPLLYASGGPVIMVQLENEFGSFGDVSSHSRDRQYLEHLLTKARQHLGEAVVIYTTDGGNKDYMRRGSLPGGDVLTLGDGGWNCEAQALFNPPGRNPCMNTEDYSGWLTHWSEHISNGSTTDCGVKAALEANHSFSIYMAHGGSNFGWMSGANGDDQMVFQPDITSYDYNAPISESGDHGFGIDGGDKFEALRNALRPYAGSEGLPDEPPALSKRAYGKVELMERADLLSDVSLRTLAPRGPVRLEHGKLVSMEFLGQNYGFVLYVADAEQTGSVLSIEGFPRDRAQVFVDGELHGAIYRPQSSLKLRSQVQNGAELRLLVENMGRLNFGSGMNDPKGINTNVLLDGKSASADWSAWSLPLDYTEVSNLPFKNITSCVSSTGPAFYRGTLRLPVGEAPADTWLRPGNFTKGIMWVNGHNLGRYWQAEGPQLAFYVPAPFLTTGHNEVVLLELDKPAASCEVSFDDKPDFSGSPHDQVCQQLPQEGALLELRSCDGSLGSIQTWSLTSDGHLELGATSDQLTGRRGGGVGTAMPGAPRFCVAVGPQADVQSGSPSARLRRCDDGVVASLSVDELTRRKTQAGQIQEAAGGRCLDVTAHGSIRGEPVEWYACVSGPTDNQVWSLHETPDHRFQVIASLDGKCLTACSPPADFKRSADARTAALGVADLAASMRSGFTSLVSPEILV